MYPDQILIIWLHQKPADLNLQCFQKDKSGFSRTRVNATCHIKSPHQAGESFSLLQESFSLLGEAFHDGGGGGE